MQASAALPSTVLQSVLVPLPVLLVGMRNDRSLRWHVDLISCWVVRYPQGLFSAPLNCAAECQGGLACLVDGVMDSRPLC
jgi:hypothetical protein